MPHFMRHVHPTALPMQRIKLFHQSIDIGHGQSLEGLRNIAASTIRGSDICKRIHSFSLIRRMWGLIPKAWSWTQHRWDNWRLLNEETLHGS